MAIEPTSRRKLRSFAQFVKSRRSASEPPVTGSGRGRVVLSRTKWTSGWSTTAQPSAVTSMARQAESPMSITIRWRSPATR